MSVNASAMYHQAGTIDSEQSGRHISYIYYDPTPAARARDSQVLQSVVDQVFQSVHLNYDASARKLSLTVGSYSETKDSDMSQGSFKSGVTFQILGNVVPGNPNPEAPPK